MPGPLPDPNKRRRNNPTIPGTGLPAAGRRGPVPKCPLELGPRGLAWWRWAWKLPQATKWGEGSLYFVARRAVLEDHAAALSFDDQLDLADLFSEGNDEAVRQVEWALGLLKRSATGEVSLFKEMRELDNRLGLNPKAMLDLRWSVEDEPEAPTLAEVKPLKIKDPRVA
jgi:hypothetical protein